MLTPDDITHFLFSNIANLTYFRILAKSTDQNKSEEIGILLVILNFSLPTLRAS